MAIPSMEVQKRLENALAEGASLGNAVTREAQLLREHRTRLVSDVVTGKLDVREAAARLPDDEPEELPRLEDVVDEPITDEVEAA